MCFEASLTIANAASSLVVNMNCLTGGNMLKKLEWDYKIAGLIIIASLLFLAMLMGKLVVGQAFFLAFGLCLFTALGFSGKLSSGLLLRSLRARQFHEEDEQYLNDLSFSLVQEAGLNKTPKFYLVPTNEINALTFGSKESPIICISQGAMGLLNHREMQGIIAHEIAHIKAGDIRLKQLLNVVNSFTNFMTGFALVACFLSLPLVYVGAGSTSMEIIMFSLIVSTLSFFLRLALSRNREYAADLEAVRLTKDPVGLANALKKSKQLLSLWGLVLRKTNQRQPCPLLQSHPQVDERIRRLLSLVSINRTWGDSWFPAGG